MGGHRPLGWMQVPGHERQPFFMGNKTDQASLLMSFPGGASHCQGSLSFRWYQVASGRHPAPSGISGGSRLVGATGPLAECRPFSIGNKTHHPSFMVSLCKRHLALPGQPELEVLAAWVWETSCGIWDFRRQQPTWGHRPLDMNASGGKI